MCFIDSSGKFVGMCSRLVIVGFVVIVWIFFVVWIICVLNFVLNIV